MLRKSLNVVESQYQPSDKTSLWLKKENGKASLYYNDGIDWKSLQSENGGDVDFSDYYTKEETDIKLLAYDIKDRAYIANQNMGYKVLDKDKSIISQMTEANTIYEIRYDFDLGGETLTVPDNCTLKFEGGSLKNGSVAGDNLKAKNLTASQISYGVFRQGVNLYSDNSYLIASEVGFVPNDASFADHNSDVLTAVLSKTTAGLDFDNTYYLSGTHDVSRELHLKNGSLIISGQSILVPKANTSIIMDKVSVSGTSSNLDILISASSINYVINAIVLTNCIFSDYCRVISISGIDSDYTETKTGIANLTIEGNTFTGRAVSRCLFYDIVVSNRCYLANNIAENFDYSLFYFAETNGAKYSGTKSIYWSDIIFENNIINGIGACNGVSYITPLLVDGCNRLYYRNNIIKNLIATEITGIAYECYASCNEYYCENNTVINVCKLPIKADVSTSSSLNYTLSEIFKSKSSGDLMLARGNKWSIDYNECRSIVEAAKQTQFADDVFNTLNSVALFGFVDTIGSLVFNDNTIITNGVLSLRKSSFPVGAITIADNTFKADKPANGILCPYWNLSLQPKTIQISRNKFDMVLGIFSQYDEVPANENVTAIVNDNIFYQEVTGLLPNTNLDLTLQNNIFFSQTDRGNIYSNSYGYITRTCFIDNLLVQFRQSFSHSFNIKYPSSWTGLMTFKLLCSLSPTHILLVPIGNKGISTVVDCIISIGSIKNMYRVTTTETRYTVSDIYGNILVDEEAGDNTKRIVINEYDTFSILVEISQDSATMGITARDYIDIVNMTIADPSQNIFKLSLTQNKYNLGIYKYDASIKKPVWWDGASWVEAVDTSNKQDKPTIEGLTNAQSVNVTGESSKLYSGASLTSLTITAAKTDLSQNGAEEVFQFSTGASPAITITGVVWANGDTPTFEANKTYEIHIIYNATLVKFLATYAVYE